MRRCWIKKHTDLSVSAASIDQLLSELGFEHYAITEEALKWPADQVCALQGIVETVCQHIRSLA